VELLANIAGYFLASPFELVGLVSGVLCVWLLIRQNIWTWPIGLLYAFVSVFVFYRTRLYADVLLHLFYVGMNAYGWYYWLSGGEKRRRSETLDSLPIAFTPAAAWLPIVGLTAGGIVALGWLFSTYTDADLAYWDGATTAMSFTAMWMTARKYIENWALWLVVDVLATGIYLYKGIELYAILYGVYIAMAIWGWRSWWQSLQRQPA